MRDALCVTDRHLSEVMIFYEDGIFGGKRQIIKHPWDAFAEKLPGSQPEAGAVIVSRGEALASTKLFHGGSHICFTSGCRRGNEA